MTDVERELMINKINNKKKTQLMQTFFNLNGVNASDDELDILQSNIDNEMIGESQDNFALNEDTPKDDEPEELEEQEEQVDTEDNEDGNIKFATNVTEI